MRIRDLILEDTPVAVGIPKPGAPAQNADQGGIEDPKALAVQKALSDRVAALEKQIASTPPPAPQAGTQGQAQAQQGTTGTVPTSTAPQPQAQQQAQQQGGAPQPQAQQTPVLAPGQKPLPNGQAPGPMGQAPVATPKIAPVAKPMGAPVVNQTANLATIAKNAAKATAGGTSVK